MVKTVRRTGNDKIRFQPNSRIIDDLEICEPIEYSTFAYAPANNGFAPRTAEVIGLQDKKRSEEKILMPRIQTFANPETTPRDISEIERRGKAREAGVVTNKIKLSLALYMIVILIMAIAVLATGVALSGASGRINSLEASIRNKNAVIVEQINTLEGLSDNKILAEKAKEIDMVEVDNVVVIEGINIVEKREYKQSSNWFDNLCDFLSGLLG